MTSQCCPDQAMIYNVSFDQSTNVIVVTVVDSKITECSGLLGYEVELKCIQGDTSFRSTKFQESSHMTNRIIVGDDITVININLTMHTLDYNRNMINALKCAIRIRGRISSTSQSSLTKENHLYLSNLTGFSSSFMKGAL